MSRTAFLVGSRQQRIRWLATGAGLALLVGLTAPATGQTPSPDGDDQVTGQRYVRHDGGSDAGIRHCNNPASSPDGESDPSSDADADATDGGSRRQANEPYSVVDPTDTDHVFAGWNDYCLSDLRAGWQGFAYSLDGGETWTDSIVPGYPQDTSAEGQASPLFGDHTDAGDPIAAFDNDGNLFVGGIAFNRTGPINGDVWVATYGTNPNGAYPVDYLRTRIVGRGTPSRNFQGIFQDKPMLEVDRTGNPATDGNVYVCWSRFTASGQNRVQFARSTDTGRTFSKPISITNPGLASVQGCDIAIEGDGDVYVTLRTFDDNSPKRADGLAYARSTNGGASFGNAQLIRTITPYNPADPTRDCGDGPFLCDAEFVFHRVPLEPRATADQNSASNGVFLVYNAIDPATVQSSQSSFSSVGNTANVGQSQAYVVFSKNNGRTWSNPVAVDEQPAGHQYFPDIDALNGELAVIWQDNRVDDDYSVQLPIGNALDGMGRPVSSDENVADAEATIVNSYVASASTATVSFGDAVTVSSVGHQPQFEMFGNRDDPFQGDYNWIALAEGDDGLFGYTTWTDNRNVSPGNDPREEDYDDNFDVVQCRDDQADDDPSGILSSQIPLARRDAPFGGDTCGNAGGLDQEIFGTSFTLP